MKSKLVCYVCKAPVSELGLIEKGAMVIEDQEYRDPPERGAAIISEKVQVDLKPVVRYQCRKGHIIYVGEEKHDEEEVIVEAPKKKKGKLTIKSLKQAKAAIEKVNKEAALDMLKQAAKNRRRK